MPADRALARTALLLASAATVLACGKRPAEPLTEPAPPPTVQMVAPAYGVPPLDMPPHAASDASARPQASTDAGKK